MDGVVRIGSLEIADAARTGAGEAFSVRVNRHYAPLLRFLTRQTGDAELAADLTQDSFFAAFRAIDQLADERSFTAWLYQIARNQLRMEFRRRRLRRFISLDWLAAQGEARLPVSHRSDTSAAHERDDIQRVLDDLSPALREALLLHDLCGFTSTEVAAILNVSPAAARKRIARAAAEFRRRYRSEGTEHHDLPL